MCPQVWIFALATVMILDVWCSHFFGHPGSYFKYPLTRFLRPAFFASRRRHLKACFMSMFKSMLACIPLIGILFVSIVFFATVGWIVFDATKNGGFSTLRSDNTNNTASNHTGFCSTADHGDGTDNNVGSCNDYFRTWPQSMYQVSPRASSYTYTSLALYTSLTLASLVHSLLTHAHAGRSGSSS